MSLPSFAKETVVLVRPIESRSGRQDNIVRTVDGAPRTDVDGCLVVPGATQDLMAGREATLIQYTLLMPPDTEIVGTDALQVRGRLFAIDGEPFLQRSGTGALDHLVVLVKVWEG